MWLTQSSPTLTSEVATRDHRACDQHVCSVSLTSHCQLQAGGQPKVTRQLQPPHPMVDGVTQMVEACMLGRVG